MWSHKCHCPFSNSLLQIPSTNYTHTMSVTTPESPPPNAEFKVITIELRVQEWYKLYVEPTRGCQLLTMEDNFLVSPEFTSNFKIPLFVSTFKICCDISINRELSRLAISPGLAQYLKPFIVDGIVEFSRLSLKEFKLVFDVNIVKIDLVNYQECDHYRKHHLV